MKANILFIYFITIFLYGSVISQLLQESEPMIIGGELANKTENKEIIAMYINSTGNIYFCAAILIDCRWALTAAHCGILAANKPEIIELRYGSANRSEGSSTRVKTVIVHEKYNASKFDFDICLLELIECLVFTETTHPTTLPCEDSKNVALSEVKCAGWGRQHDDGTSHPEVLYEVLVNVIPWLACRLLYLESLTANMFCVKNFYLGKKGLCQGDSGGYCRRESKPNGFDCSVGIISFGRSCADPIYGAVLTDVAKFIGWIKQKTGLSFPVCC